MAEWGIALSRWGNPFVAGIRPAALLQQGRDAATRAKTIGAKTEREGAYIAAVSQLYAGFETVDQPTRMRPIATRWHGRREKPERHRGRDLLFAGDRGGRVADRQDLRRPAQGRGDSREAGRSQPDHPGLAHYIIHSLRRAAARRPGARSGPALRVDRAIGAACAAHAVPHVHASRLLAGIDRHQHRVCRGGEARARDRRRAARDGLPDLRLPAERRRTAPHAASSTRSRRSKARFDPDAIGSAAPGSAGVFALAAIPARYALERGAWAEAAVLVPQPSRYPSRMR